MMEEWLDRRAPKRCVRIPTALARLAGRWLALAVTAVLVAMPLRAQENQGEDQQKVVNFAPYTVAPQLKNADEIASMLERLYPPDLKTQGITGTTTLWVQIGTDGLVRRSVVWQSSGHEAFDEVATAVASQMRFNPAQSNAGPVAVSITVPVEFTLKKEGAQAAPAPATYDTGPQLSNQAEAQRVVEALYPADLRSRKLGGRTVLWALVDENGQVKESQVKETSGYPELDRAASLAARVLEFQPALNQGHPVAVWQDLTFTFLPEGGSMVRQ